MALRLPELIVIFVVALLIFGPKKLPEMGAQIGRSLNAFKKGMSEFRRDASIDDDLFDSTGFMARHKEITALEARRLELEILERELAVKRAEAALRATQETGIYGLETTVEQDYVESEAFVEADHVAPEAIVDEGYTGPEEIDSTPVESDEEIASTTPVEFEKEAHFMPNA